MSWSRWLPLLWTERIYVSCRSVSSPSSRFSSTFEKPMIELSGVRSSWDMLARNWDLSRLACISWAFEPESSSYSRAFSSEIATWLARTASTSSSCSSKISPESFSPTRRMPVSLPSIFSGTINAALISSSSLSAASK